MKDCLKETWEDLSSRECPTVSAWTFLLPPESTAQAQAVGGLGEQTCKGSHGSGGAGSRFCPCDGPSLSQAGHCHSQVAS